jgi:hypothetical protein
VVAEEQQISVLEELVAQVGAGMVGTILLLAELLAQQIQVEAVVEALAIQGITAWLVAAVLYACNILHICQYTP